MVAATPQDFLADARPELEGTSYLPLGHLASGTFGDVFVVRHRELGTELVLKLLKPEFRMREDVVERLKVEARILTRLAHPNLIRVTDFGWSRGGRPFLVTEKLVGETLLDRVKRERLPLDVAIDLGAQMLAGLARVHEAKLVHRDIKPANLFLAQEAGRTVLKILDFGIAKILDPSEGAALGRQIPTAEGMVLGTPAYLAPEQILGKPIDARTDIYAAGCVLYRMIAGRPPFITKTQEELILAHVTQAPSPVSTHAGYPVAPEIDAAVARALAKSAEERFSSADAFSDALRAGLARTGATPTPPPVAVNRGTIRMQSNPPEAQESTLQEVPAFELDFRGSADPEEGTVYATGPKSADAPRSEVPKASGPRWAAASFELLPHQTAKPKDLASPSGSAAAAAAARPPRGLLVPALIAVILVLLVLVTVLSAQVLR